jgi:hypothetical protein
MPQNAYSNSNKSHSTGIRPVCGRQEGFLAEFILTGCEKFRSWFDMLTTSGVPQWKFKYLVSRSS